MKPILVIENFSPDSYCTPYEIASSFKTDLWLQVSSDNVAVTVLNTSLDKKLKFDINTPFDIFEFYGKLTMFSEPGQSIVRIRNPYFPLSNLFWSELCEQFPESSFEYVLSTADECGLQGFFLERFSIKAFQMIKDLPYPIMPPGYFNGMSLGFSGRHWFSLSLRQFYLRDHFKTLYNSPRWIAINAIPSCNYKCIKCQYHSPKINPVKFGANLSASKISNLLDRCAVYKNLNSIAPTITGEPLLHPEITDIVRIIKEKGYSCGFATNASLLNKKLSMQLIKSGIDGLAFSVDAVNPDTYSAIQGGNLAVVEKNILDFKEEMIRQRGVFSGSVICVVSNDNVHELEEYREQWLGRGFTVIFSAEHNILENFKPYFSHKKWAPSQRMPCFALWLGLYLTNDGSVVTCGSMAKSKGLVANIFQDDPLHLWHSKALHTLRTQQLSGMSPYYCHEFSCWTGQMSTWVHENDRLICHTQGSWLEQPPTSAGPSTKHWYSKINKQIKSFFK